MIDFIIRYWMEALFTAVLGLLGWLFRTYTQRIKKQDEVQKAEQIALKGGIKALLRDRIIETYNQCSKKGNCPIYALENVESKALGGNGTATQLLEELKEMPRN